MMKNKNHFFLLLLFLLSKISFIYGEPLASYDGGRIEESEVLKEGAVVLYEYKLRQDELKQQILLGILKTKLIETEMKNSHKDLNQLLVEFIDQNYSKDAVQKAKESVKSPGNSLDSEDESTQLKSEIENRYLLSLVKKYHVKFNLNRPQPPVIDIETKGQPAWGKSNAKVTVVEFADFECPYCKKMQTDIQEIKKNYSDKIRWVFIDFPLDFHRNSFFAHLAAHCAEDQNKFFDFNQMLYQSTPDLEKKTIMALVEKLKLDHGKFETCIADSQGKKKNIIEHNQNYGKKLGVSGTPTIFVNGKYYPGVIDYNDLKEIIDGEL